MEFLNNVIHNTKIYDDEVLDQILEVIEEIDILDEKLYIIINDLKLIIKDYETFATRDKIQDIISKIDILLIDYINNNTQETINENENEVIKEQQERTDKDLIPDDTIEINQDAVLIFNDVLKTESKSNARLDLFFSDERCMDINMKWIKDKSNPYGLDPYGLVIRKKYLNKTGNEYGWKYDEHNIPIHININNTCTRDENINNVLNIQYQKNKKSFEEKGIIYQIYTKHFPERLEKFKSNL